MKDAEDEAFEELALKQGHWQHTSGWRKKQIMDKIEQAFPNPHRTDMGGMSLRDYFAAKAMQTYLADKELIDMFVYMNADVKEQVARTAYQMADAMLKAREA
jgi:tRNA nucleotidyltransferase (CCA-adding enzyme)